MDKLMRKIWQNKIIFLGTFFVVFTLSYIVLVAIDFLPEQPTAEDVGKKEVNGVGALAVVKDVVVGETEIEVVNISENSNTIEVVNRQTAVTNDLQILPVSITIDKLDKTVTVLNPMSRTIADLDEALLDGVVRHPDSATLSQEGNIFILGHSSYLPTVFNKNFQALNGIQSLEWGDIIKVNSADTVYSYRVEKVYRAKAQDVTVPIAGTGKMLTLATCNSFGSTDDRYIVEAKQTSVQKL